MSHVPHPHFRVRGLHGRQPAEPSRVISRATGLVREYRGDQHNRDNERGGHDQVLIGFRRMSTCMYVCTRAKFRSLRSTLPRLNIGRKQNVRIRYILLRRT